MNTRLTAFCVTLIATTSIATAGDWTQWRGNDRNGVAGDSPALLTALPDAGLKPLWKSAAIGSGKNEGGWGSPVVVNSDAGQRVYLFTHKRVKIREVPKKKFPWLSPDKRVGMTAEEYAEYEVKRRNEDEAIAKAYVFRESIYCLDGDTGETVWTNENDSLYTRFPQSGSPTVADGRLYVLGAGGHVRSIDAATGDDIWKVRLPIDHRDEFWQSSFLVADDLAIFLCGHLFAVSVKDGSIAWEGDPATTGGTHSSPVLWQHDGRNFVIANVRQATACFDAKTGDELWRVPSEAKYSTPVVQDDLVVTYGDSRKKGLRCYRMSLDGAEHLWTYNGCQDKGSSPVIVGDHVFVQGEKRLACVNLESGDGEWLVTLDLGRPQYTSLVAADSKVYYALEGLLCFAATAEEFTPHFNAKFDDAGLVASEDSLRQLHGIDALEKQDQGKAERLYQSKIGRQGPLVCASPAIADGRMFVRMNNGIACYDLRAN